MKKWGYINGNKDKVTCRLDSKDCFVEVRTDALFSIGKIAISFVRFDPSKPIYHRQVEKVKIYLDPEVAMALSNLITSPGLNGIIQMSNQALAAAASGGKMYPDAVWQSTPGGKKLDDGTVICRQLSIYPGIQQEYIITATSGKSKYSKKGIEFDGDPSVIIRIPVDAFGLYKFAAGLEAAFIGYCANTYTFKPTKEDLEYAELSNQIAKEEWDQLFNSFSDSDGWDNDF